MDTAAALEAIRRLKYAYFRHLDLKQFDDLGALLTEDATASYEDGKTVLEGRAAIASWLAAVLGDPGIVTEHQGHHPEITFTSDTAAEGTWYLQDRVDRAGGRRRNRRHGVLRRPLPADGGGWRIAHTGYTRVFEEQRTHSTFEVRSFASRFDQPG